MTPTASRLALAMLLAAPPAGAYVNFEASHVHPITLTPSGTRLLAVNTPDARLEVFTIAADGTPMPTASIPVGLEPVSVRARSDDEAWVVSQISDSVSIVDLVTATTIRTLRVGDEPSDVVFAAGKAFVAVSQEDAVKVYDLADLTAPPTVVPLFGRAVRALAVARGGGAIYAVVLRSGNQTSVVSANVILGNNSRLDPARLAALGLNDMRCAAPPPAYPPLPAGIQRNPALTDPPSGIPPVALIVHFNRQSGRWEDDATPPQDWTPCLPFRLPDHDLFVIDATTLAVSTVDHIGTSLFEVAVHPLNGKVYVPHTEARNFVRFEHALGVRGHVVDNRMAIVDPAAGYAVSLLDLNAHIDRMSDPATNRVEREASISQPGMMVFQSDGSQAYLTAIGSRKLFVYDPACIAAGCVFGPDRRAPRAVVVGQGPTGVALLEARSRAYVLNRLDHSISVVDTAALTRIADLPLFDPSPAAVRDGRRFLYDATLSSGHGDAACSSCHISGDHDGLAWDLGDPSGAFVPYATAADNVRFIAPVGGQPTECPPANCAAHQGFDPQKGPMTTQTLRGMLEPLHWRGDRATMNEFNPAFVGLLGALDVGPVNGRPAGISAAEMESFRQFSLAMTFPPNPHRNVDDSLPNRDVQVPGQPFAGNPSRGSLIFDTFPTDGGQPCQSCHAHPFGAAGGKLLGVTPQEPTSPDAAALFNGDADLSPHSDVKVPHLRNLYDKLGPRFGLAASPTAAKSGFGLAHDGVLPDLATFFSVDVFTLSPANGARDVRDVASFVLHFPTGMRPCAGQQVTVPAGPPPTAPAGDESLLATLLAIADPASADPHGEVYATAFSGGRLRTWLLAPGGRFTTDVSGETAPTTAELRRDAAGPITFTCAPLGEGPRLGLDRDGDGRRNGEDCADGDPASWAAPLPVRPLHVTRVLPGGPAHLSWDEQATRAGPGLVYDLIGGRVSDLHRLGPDAAAACIAGGIVPASQDDLRPDPPPGEAYYYLLRARNGCGAASFESGSGTLDQLDCP